MKTYKYIAALLLTGVVVSCQNDDFISPAYENDPDAVRIQANIAALQTRVNTDGNGDTWTGGDQIKVVNVSPNAISGKTEATYTYSNDSWSLDENSTYMVWADGTNDFQAYYPCTDGTSFSSFVLPKEQTDAERGVDKHFIGDADWMLAKESSPKTNVLPLTFSHQLVKVTVEITAYKDEYTSDATVVDPVFTVPTTLTGITGKTLSVEDNSTTVNGLKTEGSNGLHSFTAVLLPGRYAADDTFLQLTVNGQPLTVKVGSNETLATKGLEAETAYRFKLTVGKDGLTIKSVSVNPWGASDWEGEHGGTADEKTDPEVDETTHTITLAKAGTLTEDAISSAMSIGYGMGALKISGPMNDSDIRTLSSYLKTISDNEISLTLTNASFESLPDEAFKDVKWLTWIELPSTLKTIGDGAFEGCANLSAISGLENVETVGSKAFKDIFTEDGYQITFFLHSATSIGAYAFQGIGGVDIVVHLLSEDDIDVTDAFKTEDGGTASERITLFLNETKRGNGEVSDGSKTWKGYTFEGIGFTTP